MSEILGVCLCRRVDILGLYGAVFAAHAPALRLVNPGEADPATVAFALCFDPPPEAFAPYPNLRLVASIGAGADGVLGCPSRPEGVPVIRMRDDGQARQMTAFALWHVVYWHRRFDRLFAAQADGVWRREASDEGHPETVGVGVLGFGHLGRRLARALAPLGYGVRSHSRRPPTPEPGAAHFHGADSLGAFLGRCDILVNLLPMTPETRGVLAKPLFDQLPMGARLVHLGRGGQLVEADLLAALDEGRLAGASLDVFALEPLPAGHPFWRDPRIVVTPHVAAEADLKGVALTVRDALEALAAGRRPATEVDPDAGY